MRRSTLITRALGSTALVCAAVALSLVFVRYDAPAPRWDILGALGATAVTAGGGCSPAVRRHRSAPRHPPRQAGRRSRTGSRCPLVTWAGLPEPSSLS